MRSFVALLAARHLDKLEVNQLETYNCLADLAAWTELDGAIARFIL